MKLCCHAPGRRPALPSNRVENAAGHAARGVARQLSPPVALRGGGGWGAAEAGGRLAEPWGSIAAGSASLYGCYRAQGEETAEVPQPYAAALSTAELSAPLDASALYTPWSTCGDDPKQPAASQGSIKSRAQPERDDYGSETDLYGLVSDILEEQEKPQPYCAEGSCPSSLKAVWPVSASRIPEHQELLPEPKRALAGAASPQRFYGGEAVPGAEKQFLPRAEECYRGLAAGSLEEPRLYPARSERAGGPQASEAPRASPAYQYYPYLKSTFAPPAGCSELSKDLAAEAFPYGRERLGPKGAEVQLHQRWAESSLPQFHRYSEGTDYSRFPEYPAGIAKPNNSSSCSLQETKSATGTPKAPSLDTEPYSKLFQVKSGTQKKPEDRIAEQLSFPFPRAAGLLPEKQFPSEASFCTDLGPKLEYGLKAFPPCPGAGDSASGVEKQPFPKADLQSSEYCKPLPLFAGPANPAVGAGVRPAWLNSQSKAAAPGPPQPPSPLVKWNHPFPAFLKGSTHSNEFFQLPSPAFPLNSSLLLKHSQESPAFASGLDLGYSSAERARPAACLEALGRAGEETLLEYLSEKKLKQPNGFCDSFSAQQFGIIDSLSKHCFQLKPPSERRDLQGQKHVDGWLQTMYQELLESQGQFPLGKGSGDPLSCLQAPSLPSSCLMGDLRGSQQLGSGAFPLRSSHLFGHSVLPLLEPPDLFPREDVKHFYPYFSRKMCGDTSAAAFGPAFAAPRQGKTRGGPASELHLRLEECYEQWKALEKERKKTESALAKNFQGKKVSSANNIPIPRLPSKPSRVDRLIVDQLREQARVVTLLGKMERLRSSPLHAGVAAALDRHLERIQALQARRKEELVSASARQRQGAPRGQDDRGVLALALAVGELSAATRRTRTTLWCALQMTLPKPAAGKAAAAAPQLEG
ncbi:meiosis-specific coiled-coil domain-containing protein MEIOC [Dryobates pubescens]|uniref:meiosis-specific coiled-coil domain-containing protein MEIOC n=1 Tax=Dryobates pubescens TaxID=118200 RepID=UPI0023B8E4BC|nr:meiosis-specific coiled-coil domain-containing protein MEIOC [Dryobates pubescens]